MQFQPYHLYHVYNQGNNRQRIFHNENDYQTFLNLYKRLFPSRCDTVAWCLMPNHFHFMLYTDEKCLRLEKQGGNLLNPVSNAVRMLLSGYARIYNSRYGRSGSIFRQKTKAKCLTEISLDKCVAKENLLYATTCFHYIHQNPLIATLCKSMETWPYSSYKDYHLLSQETLCNMELAKKCCGFDPENFAEVSNRLYALKMGKGGEGV